MVATRKRGPSRRVWMSVRVRVGLVGVWGEGKLGAEWGGVVVRWVARVRIVGRRFEFALGVVVGVGVVW